MSFDRIPKTKVVHSESKKAWNVIGSSLGSKYKIARVPYCHDESEWSNKHLNSMWEKEAEKDAKFISECFNNREAISDFVLNVTKRGGKC